MHRAYAASARRGRADRRTGRRTPARASRSAIALMVKSRRQGRPRRCRRRSPPACAMPGRKRRCDRRDLEDVVALAQPDGAVRNAGLPTLLAQGGRSPGSAPVARRSRSESCCSRPSKASRTEPPTERDLVSAAVNRIARVSTTGETCNNAATALRCAADSAARCGLGGTAAKRTGGQRPLPNDHVYVIIESDARVLGCVLPSLDAYRIGSGRIDSGKVAAAPRSNAGEMASPRRLQRSRSGRAGRRSAAAAIAAGSRKTSAGGLVVDRVAAPQVAALIGRHDRQGRLLWSLRRVTSRTVRTAEDAAIRESRRKPASAAGCWPARHHRLLVRRRGPPHPQDCAPLPPRGVRRRAVGRGHREVEEVAWVPLTDLPGRLAYADERRLVASAHSMLELSA